jgi:probable O-glycosylation ligase (exosortase A-associated)
LLRSLWLLFLYVAFIGLGTTAPFVLALGYVWVDTFQPQNVTYVILNQLPVALIMGAASVTGYFALDRRSPPPLSLESVLQVLLTVWVTVTLAGAVAGDFAWDKWNWAFKTLAFAAFLPLVIRSRVQIEAFAATYVFSLAANFVPFGLKTLISGGGYGTNLGLGQGNSGLAEGGLLSTVCLMAVPLVLFLARHSVLMPRLRFASLAYFGIAALAVVTAVGTYERSALVGLVVLGAYMFVRSRRKLLFGMAAAAMALIALSVTTERWDARISTINNYQHEDSALTRILVWRWTLGFVSEHPLGGGFNAYVIDHVEMPPDGTHPGGYTQFGRAFHSIYFEMLGEQGWPGLAMFLCIAGSMFLSLRRLSQRVRNIPELVWAADLSDALQSGMAVFLTSGAFVGIAFQPMFWYFVAMGISLRAYVTRVERMANTPAVQGWRAAAIHGPSGALANAPSWREHPATRPLSGRPS